MLIYNGLLLVGSLLCFPVIGVALLKTPKLRAGLRQKLALKHVGIPPKSQRRVWIHCVSVGELNAAAPLIQALQADWDVVVSTTTHTGQLLAKSRYPHVLYCPLDFAWAVQSVLSKVNPDRLIVLETELWPNLFFAASKHCTDGVYVVNARLSNRSFRRYDRIKPFMQWLLSLTTGILTQSSEDTDRFRALGAHSVHTMGNLKFDVNLPVNQVLAIQFKQRLTHSFVIPGETRIVVFASTHEGEESLLIDAIHWLVQQPNIRVIVAPRHPERGFHVVKTLAFRQIASVQQSREPETSLPPGHVLVLDTIGQLTTVYAISQLAVIGGSFIDHGGQNPLEPLALSVPVITGPNMHNFAGILSLLEDTIETVPDTLTLLKSLKYWLDQPELQTRRVNKAQQILALSKGASERALQLMI